MQPNYLWAKPTLFLLLLRQWSPTACESSYCISSLRLSPPPHFLPQALTNIFLGLSDPWCPLCIYLANPSPHHHSLPFHQPAASVQVFSWQLPPLQFLSISRSWPVLHPELSYQFGETSWWQLQGHQDPKNVKLSKNIDTVNSSSYVYLPLLGVCGESSPGFKRLLSSRFSSVPFEKHS